MLDNERVRGHRVVGPLTQHKEERHWIAAAGIVVALIGIGVSTYAASEQAAAQRRQAKSQQKFREQEAETARQSAAFEERQFRRRIRFLMGKNEAIVAASGIDPASGSPLLTELDTVRQAELEALNIRRTGEVRGGISEFEARMERQRAAFARGRGQAAIATGVAQGGSSILGGWYSATRTPPGNPYSGPA